MQGKTFRDGNLINCEISIYSSLRNLLFPEENAITIELTLNQHQLKLIKIPVFQVSGWTYVTIPAVNGRFRPPCF